MILSAILYGRYKDPVCAIVSEDKIIHNKYIVNIVILFEVYLYIDLVRLLEINLNYNKAKCKCKNRYLFHSVSVL